MSETATRPFKRRELSEDFKKAYVKRLSGKEFVEYNGLRALAMAEPNFGHIKAYISQYPCKDNNFTAFARAEIYDKDGKCIGMEEADANADNCTKHVAKHYPRMALTRAKGRLLRDFLNIDMVTREELDLYEEEKADPRTIGKIKRTIRDNGISDKKMYRWLEDCTGCEELNELTQDLADEFLAYIEKKIKKLKEKAKQQAAESAE